MFCNLCLFFSNCPCNRLLVSHALLLLWLLAAGPEESMCWTGIAAPKSHTRAVKMSDPKEWKEWKEWSCYASLHFLALIIFLLSTVPSRNCVRRNCAPTAPADDAARGSCCDAATPGELRQGNEKTVGSAPSRTSTSKHVLVFLGVFSKLSRPFQTHSPL